jgi:hypothetical protein
MTLSSQRVFISDVWKRVPLREAFHTKNLVKSEIFYDTLNEFKILSRSPKSENILKKMGKMVRFLSIRGRR